MRTGRRRGVRRHGARRRDARRGAFQERGGRNCPSRCLRHPNAWIRPALPPCGDRCPRISAAEPVNHQTGVPATAALEETRDSGGLPIRLETTTQGIPLVEVRGSGSYCGRYPHPRIGLVRVDRYDQYVDLFEDRGYKGDRDYRDHHVWTVLRAWRHCFALEIRAAKPRTVGDRRRREPPALGARV